MSFSGIKLITTAEDTYVYRSHWLCKWSGWMITVINHNFTKHYACLTNLFTQRIQRIRRLWRAYLSLMGRTPSRVGRKLVYDWCIIKTEVAWDSWSHQQSPQEMQVRNPESTREQSKKGSNAGELMSHEVQHYCTDHGIHLVPIPAYRQAWNGVAERFFDTLFCMVRAMIETSQLPGFLWNYAAHHPCDLLNSCPKPPSW